MRVLGVALVLMVAACGDKGPSRDDVDVADVNARNALARVTEMQARIDDLESEIGDLRAELDDERSARLSADSDLERQVRNHYHY